MFRTKEKGEQLAGLHKLPDAELKTVQYVPRAK
jgi:hypothetical protein